jgi:hypothetical protein
VTVTGAEPGDFALAGFTLLNGEAVTMWAAVNVNNQVFAAIRNFNGAAINYGSGTVTALVFKR